MVEKFEDFLNENNRLNLTFGVDNNLVHIHGNVYKLKDLFNNYTDLIDYAFATHYKAKLKYYPSNKKFLMIDGSFNTPYDADIDEVNFKTVKVKPEFITGLEIEHKMKTIKYATDHEIRYNKVLITDFNGKILDTFEIDKNTGKLI